MSEETHPTTPLQRSAPATLPPPARPAEEDATMPLLTRRLTTLLVAQACFGYAFSSFFLLPKFLATELGVGPAGIGLLNAAYGASAVIFMFLMGVAVDRFGRRRFLTAGALLMGFASLGFLAVDEMGALIYLLRVLQGLAFSMAFVAGATLAVDEAPPDRLGQTIGIFGLTMLSMNAVAPAAVESLAERYGWAPAFASAAIGAFLCAALSRFVRERPHTPDEDVGLGSLLRVARRPEQMRAAFVIMMVGSCFGSLFVFHQLYALELGIPEVRVFFVSYALAAVFARLVLGRLGDRLGRIRVSAAMLLLYAAGALGMIALAEIGLAPLGALFGFAHGIFYPTYNAAVVERGSVRERGQIVALFQGWFNAGLAAGSFLLGFVADAYGYPTIFGLSALGVLLALTVLLSGTRGAAAP
jgi:MFS family permease